MTGDNHADLGNCHLQSWVDTKICAVHDDICRTILLGPLEKSSAQNIDNDLKNEGRDVVEDENHKDDFYA